MTFSPTPCPAPARHHPLRDVAIEAGRRAVSRARRRLGLVAGIVALLPVGLAAQQPSMGPLTYEEGSPLQRLAFTTAVEGVDGVGEGVWRVDLYNGYANIFEQDSTDTHLLFLDMERLTTAVSVRWGASETLEVGGRLTFETTGAGFLDGVVLGWHGKWGFGNANRDRFPQNRYRQRLTDGDESVYLDRPPQILDLRDVRAFAKWRFLESGDGRSALSLRTVLRIPTVGRLEGNRNPDGGAMVLGRLGMGSWYAHGVLGASISPGSDSLDPVLRGYSTFLALALERSLGGSVAAVGQLQVQSAALRSFEHRELDRAPTNLILGLAGQLGESWTWDASFQEDVPADTPAVDFTVTLRLSRTF